MKEGDLVIQELAGGFSVKVSGRANFDYAVPLRDLMRRMPAGKVWLEIDLENCEAMDSTFMGVLTMLALALQKRGQHVSLLGASVQLSKSLSDLGVAKLFKFIAGSDQSAAGGEKKSALPSGDMLTTAETVAEAHRALVDADAENAERFKQVIHFADQDVARLKQAQK